QPASEQARLSERVSAIVIADAVGLLCDVERVLGRGRRDQRVSAFVEGVARLYRLRRLHLALIAIDFLQHRVATGEPAALGIIRNAQVAHAEGRRARIVVDLERVELVAEETADATVEATIDVAPQLHEREHAVAIAAFFGDDRAEA